MAPIGTVAARESGVDIKWKRHSIGMRARLLLIKPYRPEKWYIMSRKRNRVNSEAAGVSRRGAQRNQK